MVAPNILLPHFLCIGAQKAGTAWLYHHLKDHPQISTPPFKELHYFDNPATASHFSTLLLRKKHYKASMVKFRKISFDRNLLSPRLVSWYINFFFRSRDQHWYQSLFQPGDDKITGEFTPAYSRLSMDDLQRVKKCNPAIKIIYILRDPVERILSQLRMRINRSDQLQDPLEIMESSIKSSSVLLNSNYLDNISRWQEHFPKEQMLLLFFDEMIHSPSAYLKKVLTFLGVAPTLEHINSDLHTKLNGYQYEIPAHIIRQIAEQQAVNLNNLHNAFDNKHTDRWLKKNQGRIDSHIHKQK